MPATLSRFAPPTLPPGGQPDRQTARSAAGPGPGTVLPAQRSRLAPGVSTARLTIGQPPRPRIFEHETREC